MLRRASVGIGSVLCLLALSSAASSESDSELSRCWQDLASENASTAYRAGWRLAHDPVAALKMLRQRLRPATAPNLAQIQAWVAELESPKFTVRDRAFKELEKQGELAEAALRKALAGTPQLETKRRVELLLERLQTTVAAPEKLRMIRAVSVLEILGTTPAKELLAELAKGFPQDRMTREAQESLQRLEKRFAIPESWLAWAHSPLPVAGKDSPLPFGARTRLGTILFRQEGDGKSAQFSPDSRLVISNDENAVYLWETATGKLVRKFDIAAESLAVAPKGTMLTLGVRGDMQRNGAVVWWDWQAGKEIGRVALRFVPEQIGFSPNGKQVIARNKKFLHVWDADSREEMRVWSTAGPMERLFGFSPDGSHIVVAGGKELQVLDLQSKSKVVLQGGQTNPHRTAFSPDGKFVTMHDYGESGARIWDAATGKVVWRLPDGSRSQAYSACFSEDGKVAGAMGGKDVGLWDLRTGKLLKSFPRLGHVDAISMDGRWLAASGHTVKVCNLETGKEVGVSEGHLNAIENLAFSPRFDAIMTAESGGALHLSNAETGKLKSSIDLGLDWIRGLAISPDGRYVAAGQPGSGDGMMGVWDTGSGRRVYKLAGHGVPGYGQFTMLGFSPDSRFLLSWGDDYYLRKWDMKTGKAVAENRAIPAGEKVPEEDEDGLPRRVQGRELLFGAGSQDAAFVPQGNQFLLLGQRGTLHCFDVASGKESRVLRFGGSSDFGAKLSVSPTGRHVATVGRERGGGLKLDVGDLVLGKTLFSISVPGNFGEAKFSPDGRTVAAGGGGAVVLAELATGKTLLEIPARSRRLAFSPDGRFLVTAMADTTALVWDLAALAKGSK